MSANEDTSPDKIEVTEDEPDGTRENDDSEQNDWRRDLLFISSAIYLREGEEEVKR